VPQVQRPPLHPVDTEPVHHLITPRASPAIPTLPASRLAPPSSAQLFDRLPSVADLDFITLDTQPTADEQRVGCDPLDTSLLPARADLDVAMRYFTTYINTAFQIHHEPTLQAQLDGLYDSTQRCSQGGYFTALSEVCACRS
jgi:hypothetical protein